MRTLRSPKDFTGPDLGLPSLTYQSWHEARYGAESWERLDLIAREDWAAYLRFVREVTGVPVRNGVTVTGIAPAGGLLAVTTQEGGRSTPARWCWPPARRAPGAGRSPRPCAACRATASPRRPSRSTLPL